MCRVLIDEASLSDLSVRRQSCLRDQFGLVLLMGNSPFILFN